jgi:hypothetical protein
MDVSLIQGNGHQSQTEHMLNQNQQINGHPVVCGLAYISFIEDGSTLAKNIIRRELVIHRLSTYIYAGFPATLDH